jgi:GNAT superfamily N-acetyltransferase
MGGAPSSILADVSSAPPNSLSPVSIWGEPRAPFPEEWPGLRAAINQVFRPDGGDLTRDCALFDVGNRHNSRVVVRDRGDVPGVFVGAHAAFVIRDGVVSDRRIKIGCVGAVFTTPAQRGQGLASRALIDALGGARRDADVLLVSGDRGLYRRHGLEPVPPLARFRLPAFATAAPKSEVRSARWEDLEAMAELYDTEQVRFVRSVDDWHRLWAGRTLVDAPADFSIVVRRGTIVAYMVAQRESRGAQGSPRPRRILEIAGDRGAIVEVAPLVAEELLVPSYDSSMIELGDRKGWARSARQFLITAQTLTADVPVIPWYGLNYV